MPGHKMAQCPNGGAGRGSSSSSSSSSFGTCHLCKQAGHKMANCPLKNNPNQQYSSSSSSSSSSLSSFNNLTIKKSIKLPLVFNSMWGKSSVLISPSSLLYDLKNDFTAKLIEKGIITSEEMDRRNKTAHINIEGDEEVYNKLKNTAIVLNNSTINFGTNLVEITIPPCYHMSLCYSKNIKSKADQVYSILNELIQELYINLGGKQEEEKLEESKMKEDQEQDKENDSLMCIVCYENKKNTNLKPCNHVSVCDACAIKINKCPVCRVKIESFDRVFIS